MRSEFQSQLDQIYGDVVAPELLADADLALDIALQFRALRRRRGLTQRAVAKLTGRSQQAISKIENPTHAGHSLSILKEVVEPLQAVLDVTIVPIEDLDAYQSEFPIKPVLEEPEARRQPIAENTSRPTFVGPQFSSPSRERFRWPSEDNVANADSSAEGRVISLLEWLERRAPRQVKHG